MNVEPPDQEGNAIESVVHDLHAQIEHDYPNPPVRRDAHPKAHGTVQADFVVSRSIPSDLRHGVFSLPGACFRAYVRFSNCFHIEPDLKADPRGMAVKLLGVEGEALYGAEGGTQDFLASTSDAFFIPDMLSYVDFPAAAGKNGLAVILFFLRHRLWRGLRNLSRAGAVPAMNPLAIEHYSQTPYRLGDDHRIVKYLIRPAITEALGQSLPWTPGFRLRAALATAIFYTSEIVSSRLGTALIRPLGHPDLLRRALAASLEQNDAWFELLVQAREAGMSTEDATERWPPERSPWQRVARGSVSRTTGRRAVACTDVSPRRRARRLTRGATGRRRRVPVVQSVERPGCSRTAWQHQPRPTTGKQCQRRVPAHAQRPAPRKLPRRGGVRRAGCGHAVQPWFC